VAKKPLVSERKERGIKVLIREYLLDENIMRGNLKDPKLDFGFNFVFPGGSDPKGRQRGRNFSVVKPKNKDVIEITCGTQMSPEDVKKLGTKRKHFFVELQKYLLNKNFFFHIDRDHNRYRVIDNIFLKKDGTVSKNKFYKSVRNIFTSTIYTILLLKEFCDNVLDLEDWDLK